MPQTTTTTEGYAALSKGGRLEPFSFEKPVLGPWDVEVTISHCGICHSDLHLIDNDWQVSRYPLVPGHEIIGFIAAKGDLVRELNVGDRVGIGWQRSSCQSCEWCHTGEENLCAKQEATCVGHFGGFAKTIVSDSRFAFPIPSELSSENAAPLLCGGATVYSPFIEHQVTANTRIGIIGIGGLGHLAIQFARAFGCEVTAFSCSPHKEDEAKQLGAHHFALSFNGHAESLDLVISATSTGEALASSLNLLRPKGKLVFVGAPQEKIETSVVQLLEKRRSICGSNIASAPDIKQMLRFAARHNIQAMTELFPAAEVNQALEKMRKNELRYRAVLEM